jgi:hypothetical protein
VRGVVETYADHHAGSGDGSSDAHCLGVRDLGQMAGGQRGSGLLRPSVVQETAGDVLGETAQVVVVDSIDKHRPFRADGA